MVDKLQQSMTVRDYCILTLVALLFFLPGFFTLPVMDRDEARFAQASKQMLETNDFVDIRFQDDPRHKKPVGIYWMQTATAQVFGGVSAPIWAYRIPSLLAAIVAVLGTAWAANTFLNRRTAFTAGAILASCLLLTVEARLAKTDAALLGATVIAMVALAKLWSGDKHFRYILLLWVALACGVLIKGPIIFLPVLCCIVFLSIYEKSPRWIVLQRSHFIGIILFLCIALPWYILISLKTDGAFFQEALGTDLSKKIISSQESHGAPPGVFLLSTLGTFWPWTPILILSVVLLWKHRKERPVIFCVAWAIPAWIILELVPTKLPHYVLPLFPALAILTAYSLEKFGKIHWFGKVLFSVIGFILVIAMVGAPKYFNESLHPISLVMSILAIAAIIVYCRRSNSIALFVTAWLVYTGMIAGTLAHLETPFISTKLSKIINSCIPEQPFAIAGYHEPSLVFLTQTKIKLVTAEQAVALLQSGDVPLSFIPSNLEKPANTFAIANVTGLNYNGGDPVDLTGYAKNQDLCLETSSRQ